MKELTTELTKVGLDTSRIEERAAAIAKMRGAKRKRHDQDGDGDRDMDVDGDGDGDGDRDGEDAWMDVDDEGKKNKSNKRVKGNTGRVIGVNRRAARTNRQLAGMRDAAVRFFLRRLACSLLIYFVFLSFPPLFFGCFSKHQKRSSYVISRSVLATGLPRLAKVIAQSELKWCSLYSALSLCIILTYTFSPLSSQNIFSLGSGKEGRRVEGDQPQTVWSVDCICHSMSIILRRPLDRQVSCNGPTIKAGAPRLVHVRNRNQKLHTKEAPNVISQT